MRRLVFDFAELRPIFRCPPEVPARLRVLLPPDWELLTPPGEVDGSGDGGGRLSPAAQAALRDAEVYMGMGLPAGAVSQAPALRWLHTGTAGVGPKLLAAVAERGIVLTNSAGIHGPPMAETVLGMILHFARGLHEALEIQRVRGWAKPALEEDPGLIREVAGSTVGIIGYGGIGREVALRVRALGARVLALRRREVSGDAAGDEIVTGREGFARLLAESDYVVLTAPATAETRGLLGEAELRALKPTAVVVNVSRGVLVDEAALARALVEGRIRGAALDVFAHEPLPADHPLREAPRLLLTPHTSAYSWRFWEREAALIEDNLRRFLAGQPLQNVVDPAAGY
jgi:phosphoglycerate dehydrogenase-like enzyme